MSLISFRVEAWFEATDARLTTDTAADAKPTRTLGASNGDIGAQRFHHGVISTIAIRLNPTNAVTYTFEVLEDDSGANASYQLRANNLFKSWDNSAADVAACADDAEYKWEGLDIPFYIRDVGDFWYNIDWSGAPGNTTGYILIGGVREV